MAGGSCSVDSIQTARCQASDRQLFTYEQTAVSKVTREGSYEEGDFFFFSFFLIFNLLLEWIIHF
jgi:hypothetical protein